MTTKYDFPAAQHHDLLAFADDKLGTVVVSLSDRPLSMRLA
jgi:hypothetical protein